MEETRVTLYRVGQKATTASAGISPEGGGAGEGRRGGNHYYYHCYDDGSKVDE